MDRSLSPGRTQARVGLALALATLVFTVGADGEAGAGLDLEFVAQPARRLAEQAQAWYRRTAPADRVTWGGLAASAALALGVLLERSPRLRRSRNIPRDFASRFLGRLQEGKLDRGKALDFCELNPSPAARVALGAVRRWDRSVSDQERAVAMTCRLEADRLRRNVGTLRRVAALAPLIGLLGSLTACGRALSTLGAAGHGPAWGPALANALAPLTVGVALAILALIAYDGLVGRVESLVESLERVGAETVDAISLSAPPDPRGGRTPHSHRSELPGPRIRSGERDDGFA